MANTFNEKGWGMHSRQHEYVRRASLALSLAVTIHLSWIALYYIQLTLFPSHDVKKPGPGIIIITPPPEIPVDIPVGTGENNLPPRGIVPSVKISGAEFGIPVPVPEPVSDPGDFGPTSEGGAYDVPEGNGEFHDVPDGGIVPNNSEPSPDSVIIVEKNPVPVKMVTPEYPELARQLGVEGTVWVKILVDREGRAKKALVIKSDNALLNDNATTAALGWLFTPAMMTNGPVMVWAAVPFKFRLQHRW